MLLQLQLQLTDGLSLCYQAAEKLAFAVLVLNHTAALLDQDQDRDQEHDQEQDQDQDRDQEQGLALWDQNAVDSFVNLISQQADGLRSCVSSGFPS